MSDFVKKLVITLLFFLSNISSATGDVEIRQFSKRNNESWLLGYGGNYPIADSADDFGPSIYHPIVGVRYTTESWVMGISMQFKFLRDKEDDSKLAIWSLEEELSYRTRLYHPVYMLTGIKFLYLLPVQGGVYPFRRRYDFDPEIGVGTTVSFLYFFSEQTAIGVFADVWRGTASRTFEGIETGIHIMLPLGF